ncbi:DNA polymerase delta subunit 2 [Coelomomyces lativittatus]|nr:DNA polymerase delta subunit 2 [Coelomomyces lativittatus]
MLFDYLNGDLGSEEDRNLINQMSHFVLVGHSAFTLEAQNLLDTFLSNLVSRVPVVLVPGVDDVTTQVMPQQPWHRSLFKRTCHSNEFYTSTNPMVAELAGFTIVAVGGQNLDDVYKYLPDENRLSMATQFLKWQHLAPTAPDTLWCYPYLQKDPFVLEKKPRLFVIGNQPNFETSLFTDDYNPTEQTRVLLIPKFQTSSMFVLVDLVTLNYRVFQISVPS